MPQAASGAAAAAGAGARARRWGQGGPGGTTWQNAHAGVIVCTFTYLLVGAAVFDALESWSRDDRAAAAGAAAAGAASAPYLSARAAMEELERVAAPRRYQGRRAVAPPALHAITVITTIGNYSPGGGGDQGWALRFWGNPSRLGLGNSPGGRSRIPRSQKPEFSLVRRSGGDRARGRRRILAPDLTSGRASPNLSLPGCERALWDWRV